MCKEKKRAWKFNKDSTRSSGISGRCKKCQRIIERKYKKKRDPVKQSARMKVNLAVASGKLIRKPCKVCKSIIKVEGHHSDYSKPLKVIWLCQKHHLEHHAKESKKLREKTN